MKKKEKWMSNVTKRFVVISNDIKFTLVILRAYYGVNKQQQHLQQQQQQQQSLKVAFGVDSHN